MNQNKGIGAYQKRPGYFMGGMIGGAILGALVNKIQGKDWKRGALFGGITGGLGSFAASRMAPAAGTKLNMFQKLLYNPVTKGAGAQGYELIPALAKFGGLGAGAIAGAGGAYMAGDPEYDKRKMEEAMFAEEERRKKKNIEMYPDWYKNFFGDFFKNEGGIINARPGYYNGGGAYSDVPMEESGPTMDPEIMRLPMGQEGSFEDESEGILGLDIAGLSDEEKGELQSLMMLRLMTPRDDPKYEQIEIRIQELMGGMDTAMSAPHPMEGYVNMYDDMIGSGEFEGTFDEFMEMIRDSDFDTFQAADGGLMRLHAKDGLWANIHAKRKRIEGGSGETMRSPGSKGAPTDKALRESQATGGIMGYYGGGMSDMDLTQGGASFGPGTGTSDDIPAMLSDGEFVVTAKAVENLGGGNRMLGAKKMYQMMNSLDPNSQTPAEMDTTGIA